MPYSARTDGTKKGSHGAEREPLSDPHLFKEDGRRTDSQKRHGVPVGRQSDESAGPKSGWLSTVGLAGANLERESEPDRRCGCLVSALENPLCISPYSTVRDLTSRFEELARAGTFAACGGTDGLESLAETQRGRLEGGSDGTRGGVWIGEEDGKAPGS